MIYVQSILYIFIKLEYIPYLSDNLIQYTRHILSTGFGHCPADITRPLPV